MSEEKKEEKKKEGKFSLTEIPTQTEVVFKDNETDTLYDEKGLLLEIANKLEEIKKVVG